MAEQYVLKTATGSEYPVTGITHIGREQSNTVPLNDTSASRHHATVWVENGKLVISDNHSANGVFVNDSQIPANKPKALRNGDRIRIGQTDLIVNVTRSRSEGTVVLPQPRSRSRLPLVACVTLIVVGCVLLIGAPLVGVYAFNWQLPGLPITAPPSAIAQLSPSVPVTLTPQPTVVNLNAVVVAVATPALVEPQRFGPQSEQLAAAVADLNQSELEFVRAASTGGHSTKGGLAAPNLDEMDDRLAQVAADALNVAAIADSLSLTAASQAGGSDNAGQVASFYTSIAQLTSALVIEAQNLRDKLASGEIAPLDAALVISEYGGRLWNPSASPDPSNPTNPFAASLTDPSTLPSPQTITAGDLDNLLVASGEAPISFMWLAASSETVTKTLAIPPPNSPPVDPNDPAVIARLTTAEGQKTEPNAARQVASAIIGAGGGVDLNSDQPTGGDVVAAFWSSTAVTSPTTDSANGTPSRNLPTFPGGQAVTIIPKPSGEPIANLLGVGSDNSLTLDGQVPITETQPIVTLVISNLNITQINKRPKDAFNTFEADVTYEFDVEWHSNLVSPQFELDCVSGNHFSITTPNGGQHISAKGLLILYPGAEDAYCYASRNGNTLGSVSIHFLVGDAAEATQRALQVETDSASLDLTLTADALGTIQASQTNAASTQSVIGTENALSTEVYGTQTAEFIATITQIARLTASAIPEITLTPTATATFTPVLIDSTFHPGDVFAVNTNVALQPGRLYRICLSGTVNLTTGPVRPSDIDSVNGIKLPASGCVVIEGNGAVATISCSSGEPDPENPGGFAVEVYDLGPS